MFVDQYPIPNNSSVSDLIQFASPTVPTASRTFLSNSSGVSDKVQNSNRKAFDASSTTLKTCSYSSKDQRKIRALAHTMYQRAEKAQCLPFIFTVTVPGSTLEAAFAVDQYAVTLIRALVAKIRANWLDGDSFDYLAVFERENNNPLHSQGLFVLPKSAWKFAADEQLNELFAECLRELSGSTGVNLFEANDGIKWRHCRCQLETVRDQDAWSNYLAKSESKNPLMLPDGRLSSPIAWFDANKGLRSACKLGTFKCHFQVSSFSEGLGLIDHQLIPVVEKITGELDWRTHINPELGRRIGSFTTIPPSQLSKVTSALKKFQRKALCNQRALLHCPDLLMSLDAGGALMLRLRQKRIA